MRTMGTFRHRVEVGGPEGSRLEALEALVDKEATYTWIPQPVLERLGHKPSLRRRLRLADGLNQQLIPIVSMLV